MFEQHIWIKPPDPPKAAPIVCAKAMTQEELDKYIKNCALKTGQFVTTFGPKVQNISQIDYILDFVTSAEKIRYTHHNDPRILKLMACRVVNDIPPWVRDDSVFGYRTLDEDEYKQFIVLNHASLQNSIKQAKGF